MSGSKRAATDDGSKDSKKLKQNGHHDTGSAPAADETKLKKLNATSSRDAHQKQKAVAKERKKAKPNADSIQRSKQLWERLRRKSHVEKEERKKLVEELFSIVTGNIYDYVFKHDSVRVIQCALKYANEQQKTMIADELKGHFKFLIESKYGKFLAAKLLVTGNEKVKAMIISEFYGKVRQIINHPEASWILDDTYRQVATPKQKASLLREWYGSEFAIFKAPASDTKPTADLSKILEDNPEKRRPILKYLFELINQLIQKKMTGFTMLHDAMLQYSLAIGSPSTSENASEFLELLKGDEEGDLLKNLAFTKSGSRVLCRALAYSNAKDRKIILRVFKDLINDLAHDPNGMHVLLAAYEVIDDTVMTNKSIISELLGSKLVTPEERHAHIIEQATNIVARIPLLYPLAGTKAKYLSTPNSETSHIITEMHTLRTETSKKDPSLRRTELVKALSQNGTLLSTVETHASELMQSSFGCQFITEVILSCEGEKTAAMTVVADLAAKGHTTNESHMCHSSHAGKMLRTLAMGQKFDTSRSKAEQGDAKDANEGRGVPDRLGFAELLYARIKGQLLGWALSENSFLVANFFDDRGFREKGDVIKRLRKHLPELQESSGRGNKGASLLLVSM